MHLIITIQHHYTDGNSMIRSLNRNGIGTKESDLELDMNQLQFMNFEWNHANKRVNITDESEGGKIRRL